jgi:hypothetical protein
MDPDPDNLKTRTLIRIPLWGSTRTYELLERKTPGFCVNHLPVEADGAMKMIHEKNLKFRNLVLLSFLY